ncbi:HAD family acid phosphatase [Streptomyces cyaneofuscatus]|uniref:HAD family acid phosphatase n=1 Tax=Streptomyces cyaneofuscatus TaxID=66883 RepID=UPI0036478159
MRASTPLNRLAVALAALALVAVPVTTASAAPASGTAPAAVLSASEAALGVDYTAWKRDVAAVVAEARPWIQARSEKAGTEKQAIVLDIDNTSLETYFHPFWQQPTPAIAEVLDLVRYADSRGVDIFFVTARPGIVESLTRWNLRTTGYPVDGLYVTDFGDLFQIAAYKAEKRAVIEAKGYRIIANIGNNDSDFAGGHAERGFKLPDYGGKLS